LPPVGGNAYSFQTPKSGKNVKGNYILVHKRCPHDILLLINKVLKILIF